MKAAGLHFLHGTALIVYLLVKRRSSEVLFNIAFNILPRYCDVEELWQFFPKNYFHVVFVSNALDHTVHPIRGLKLLLWVLHPDGKLLLRHFRLTSLPTLSMCVDVCQLYAVLIWPHRRNVHPERWMSLSDGQHQWGFDVDVGASGSLTTLVCTDALHCTAANKCK